MQANNTTSLSQEIEMMAVVITNNSVEKVLPPTSHRNLTGVVTTGEQIMAGAVPDMATIKLTTIEKCTSQLGLEGQIDQGYQ